MRIKMKVLVWTCEKSLFGQMLMFLQHKLSEIVSKPAFFSVQRLCLSALCDKGAVINTVVLFELLYKHCCNIGTHQQNVLATGDSLVLLHAAFRTPNLKARLASAKEEFRAMW